MAKYTYRLKGHESFYLREGWLTKGLRAVVEDPQVFYKNSGADALGVGTNMAKSIRYWMKTAGLIQESTKTGAELTEIGKLIFDNDLYIEDIFTLWIIHINIVLNYTSATSWSVFFNDFDLSMFKRDEMNDLMKRLIIDATGDIKLPDRSIRDDCTAIISMYSKSKDDNTDPEDKKVSPFIALGLLKQNGMNFSKEQPLQTLVDPLIVLYIIRDKLVEENALSIDEVVEGKNMPGKLLNLSRVLCNEHLDQLANREYIVVNRTAGLDMIYPQFILEKPDILKAHYLGDKPKHILIEEAKA